MNERIDDRSVLDDLSEITESDLDPGTEGFDEETSESEPKPESPDTQPETETETEAEGDKVAEPADTETDKGTAGQAEFDELGLGNEPALKEGIKMLPRAYQESRAYNSRLQQENARLRTEAQAHIDNAPEPPQKTPEELAETFAVDPRAGAKQLGLATQEDLSATNETIRSLVEKAERAEITTFRASHKDFDSYKGRMGQLYQENPMLERLGTTRALEFLYGTAKAERIPTLISEAQKRSTTTVTAESKKRANTSSGGKGKTTEPSQVEVADMSSKEYFKHSGLKYDDEA